MKVEAKTARKGPSRVDVLEEQVRARDHEIELLRVELAEKESVIARLAEPHLEREERLLAEVESLRAELSRSLAEMEHMTAILQEAEETIAALVRDKEGLQARIAELQAEAHQAEEDYAENLAKEVRWYGRKTMFVGTLAFAVGITPFILLMAVPFVLRIFGDGRAAPTSPAYEYSLPNSPRPFSTPHQDDSLPELTLP